MKVLTEFGEKEIKQKKVFEYNNHVFTLCEVSNNKRNLIRCIHYYSGKILPINYTSQSTLKSHIEESKRQLKIFEDKVGEQTFKKELNRFKTINTEISGKWKIH